MLVRDVMETDLVTVPATDDLREAVGEMLENRVGSVIVTSEGTPTGIVTETDVLLATYVTDEPLSGVRVADVMTHPLETIQPDRTLRAAVERMEAAGVKKLPVMDGMDLLGILTRSDVTALYHDIVREAHALDEQREGWESEALRSNEISDLETLR